MLSSCNAQTPSSALGLAGQKALWLLALMQAPMPRMLASLWP